MSRGASKINIQVYVTSKDPHPVTLGIEEHQGKQPPLNNDILEVDNVPSLRSLVYKTNWIMRYRPVLIKMGTIGSLRKLYLNNVSMDDAFSGMIKSNFPFLESLTLKIKWCSVEILDIRCLTLRSLKLCFRQDEQDRPFKVQVYAPKLLLYSHTSSAMPSLLFPTIPPEQIELSLKLDNPIDELFFLKMREALDISSKFNINISAYGGGVLVPFNIDDMRKILPFPATSVEELVFSKTFIERPVLWENSLLFDAFFSISHPIYVKANTTELKLRVANYFLNLIGKVYCEIRNPLDGSWVALTSSSLSLLETTTPRGSNLEFELSEFEFSEFKLSWCSP